METEQEKWVERLARAGYLTKGIVYGLIGILAVQTAVGLGGKRTGTTGALRTIAAQPFGKILLILTAIGLVGYALWRIVQAWKDPENKGTDAKGILMRLGYLISGIIYGSLAFQAISLVSDVASSGGDKSPSDWTAIVMEQPFGRWLIGLVGAFLIGLGFYQFYKAYTVKFRQKLKLHQMSPQEQTWAIRISRIGIAARGIVFAMLGFFLLQAAHQYNPQKARGLDGLLETLARQPFGKLLLGLMALGLIAYGIYMWVQSRYSYLKYD